MKYIFIGLGIIGVIIISILAFTSDMAFENIPALTAFSFDAPFWFKAIIGGGSLYLMILYGIYDELNKEV